MKTRFTSAVIIGVIISTAIGILLYQQMYDQNCLEDKGDITGFLQCTKTFEDFTGPKVKGKMAQEICSIIGGDCPEFYSGNFNQNGSITVEKIIYGRGGWNAYYQFLIQNETMTYVKTIKENKN